MIKALKILFLCCFSYSIAQDTVEVKFEFLSPEYASIGKKIEHVDPEFFTLYIDESKEDDRKLLIDEKGIYFDDGETMFFDASNENHILYQDHSMYWLFKKGEEDKSWKLFEMNLMHKPGQISHGSWAEVCIPGSKVEDFLTDCKADKIKAKYKDGLITLPALNEYFFDYYKFSKKKKYAFTKDPELDAVIESPDCSPGNPFHWLDDAQYDVLILKETATDADGNATPSKLVIDETGVYFDKGGDDKQYLFKKDDPDYVWHRAEREYLLYQKLPSGYWNMYSMTAKGKSVKLYQIKKGNHEFYSLSKHKVINGRITYFICNELEKYLLYAKMPIGEFQGQKAHW